MNTTIAFDFETDGLDPYRGARPFAYAICDTSGVSSVYRQDRMGPVAFRAQLQEFMDDVSIEKVSHKFHFELSMLLEDGYEVPEDTIWHDTILQSQLLNNMEPDHGLDNIAGKLCNDPATRREWHAADEAIEKARKIYGTYDKIPEYLMHPYQVADVERGILLHLTLFPLIARDPVLLREYYNEIETVKATVEMERRGLLVDKAAALKLIDWMTGELENIPLVCNYRSGPQLTNLLYTQKALPIQYNKRTKKPSVDKNALEALRYLTTDPEVLELIDNILKFRSYSNGVTTVKSYLTAAGKDGVLHPHVNTNEAGTGRESSTNPNMQNTQKEVGLRTKFSVPARRCFRARPRYTLDLADYAGIEMRLAVQATGSARLYKLLEEDYDFHDACARLFYGTRYTDPEEALRFYLSANPDNQKSYAKLCAEIGRDEATAQTYFKVKKILRSAAKNGRFAMLYGAGIGQVADTLAISVAEARVGCNRDKIEFPEFYQLMDDCTYRARRDGYIITFFGRKLRIDPSRPYSSTDYLIQGSAAGLFKRAQVKVSRWLRENGLDMHFLLPVHDELIFEKHRSLLPQQDEIWNSISDLMTQHDEIKVKLAVEWKQSTLTWDLAREVKK